MNIVLDTNIIRQDFPLKDKYFAIARDYLIKTDSKFVLPQIVLEEILGLYTATLKAEVSKFSNNSSKLKSMLLVSKSPEVPSIEMQAEVEAYKAYLLEQLGIKIGNVVDYKSEYLNDLVRRAINRVKPLGASGQGFRDGILWLSLLDIAASQSDKRLLFISNNPKDFCGDDESALNDELAREANKRGVEIHFFKGLSEFAEGQASKINFLDDKWISANVDFNKMEEMFERTLKGEERAILRSLEKPIWRSDDQIEGISATGCISSSLSSFFVYEMADGIILLNLEIEFEAEYEVEKTIVGERQSGHMKMVAKYNPLTDDFDYEPEYFPPPEPATEHKYEYQYPLFIGKFILTIVEKAITEYSFEEWDWG